MAKEAESLLLSTKWQIKLISRIKARIMWQKRGKTKAPRTGEQQQETAN
jgi:hypothetical protein